MIATDRGLVLRSYKLRETSKIVSILGFHLGRVRLVAHGGRGAASRFGASLEVGNEVEIVYSVTPNRELGTLREATLRQAWLANLRRLEPLGVGMAMLELLDRLVPEGAAEAGLGETTAAVLAALHDTSDRAGALLLFYAFELQLLARMGLRPALAACDVCGTAAGTVPGTLDLDAGAYRCRTCGGTSPGRSAVTAEVAGLLASLARLDWVEIGSLQTTPRMRRQAGLCLHRLLATHLERYSYPRSLVLLKKVDGGSVSGPTPETAPGFPTGA